MFTGVVSLSFMVTDELKYTVKANASGVYQVDLYDMTGEGL